MKKLFFLLVFFFTLYATATAAALQTREIDYTAGDTQLKGYLAYNDAIEGKRPGILVVHEWWGHNSYVRKRAEMLAGLGYTALAIDMYGDGKTAVHPEEAGRFAGEVRKNMPVARDRFQAAMQILKNEQTVDPGKIAAIGYCFGGGIVLEMARSGFELDGIVSFHGTLTTAHPARPGEVIARVLVLNGADDPFIKAEDIESFKKEMEAAGVNFQFVNYPGATHAFTNPDADRFGKEFNLPLAYNQEADEKSWQAMQEFFKEIFK